ncbi:hypothetical protein Thein_0812 [Thermodesulfatator indicus DSM 15286]|uniref:HEPN domain-containing protein n=1 Tax=Thermodesulfatator indicus (strain DSM 15286 / JCM 11887 / CIR29812) TaxID=667014 RepID=F8ACI7_THEID|nr:hypothetical protein [Thermodesulfatator indicus]AEH44690.1 hypothetical protein Thein_0812 [Thermodesulfatator indicus DSM 15286]
MPYYIRARTYFKYAEEQIAFAEEEKDPEKILKFANEAIDRAVRALWAIVQIEAPKEKPSFEKILAELDKACEPELAKEIKNNINRLKELTKNPSLEAAKEALVLARQVVRRAREVLEPIIGPAKRVDQHRRLLF